MDCDCAKLVRMNVFQTKQMSSPLFSHEGEGVLESRGPPPLLGEVVLEKRSHPVVADGPVEAPHQRLLLHRKVEDGSVQRVVLGLRASMNYNDVLSCNILFQQPPF